MDINATNYRSGPLSGPVEELCYHDQGVVESNGERSRTIASYNAEIDCHSIIIHEAKLLQLWLSYIDDLVDKGYVTLDISQVTDGHKLCPCHATEGHKCCRVTEVMS
jgi:hypothetical protein